MEKELEFLRKVAYEAFADSTPYLQNMEWVKEILIEGLMKTESLKGFEGFIEERIKDEVSEDKKVDLRIYLTFLLKLWRRKVG